ncbi:hypothetical protein [Dictyobacter arantiisoli]|uniref:Uncharacterized protein n=1 Tax=Dictyobacter arantiisoli TaxID=2014874 RepID=A0A5A5TA01_9CHLR|nr:hypothetical protein [Dictyobacter arantiisoli]GCF08340.1 hypothetical protein KDI_19040 [Dictyobacter arantiisoli]
MDAEEILARTNEDATTPENWAVFSLQKGKLVWALVGWLLGVLMGAGLLAIIIPIVIPNNYERGIASIILTTILLGVLLFIMFGSLGMFIVDLQRLRHPRLHKIVLTETDFVKREGAKIIQVPLINVRHVTARGRAPVDRTIPTATSVSNMQGAGENLMGFVFGRGTTAAGQRQAQKRKRVRTPTSLAFLDDRTDTEVTVVNDNAYGDPYTIAAIIKQFVVSAQAEATAQVSDVSQ